MRCPFLREAQVKYCQASPYRKMIQRTPEHEAPERCSSPAYVDCPSAKQHHEDLPSAAHCPFLQESLVQYCSAASVTRFIPYSESLVSRCGNDSHRFCELFLALANPPGTRAVPGPGAAEKMQNGESLIDGVRVPQWLSYAANHMWLDISADGYCHVGLDAFLSRVVGAIEKIVFTAARGISRPAAVLTVMGADLQLVFPNRFVVTRSNNYLRADPGRLLSDPYGLGWLFEGQPIGDGAVGRVGVAEGLIPGEAAPGWMKEETRRVTDFIRDKLAKTSLQGAPQMTDGGSFAPGFVAHLGRDEILDLYNEFFSPYASWRK